MKRQVKNLDVVHDEGEGKHSQSNERKKYFSFSELLGEEPRKKRVAAGESSREMI